MQDGVLDAAAIEIDRAPICDFLRIERQRVVVRVREPVEVPRGIDEGVHGVGLALGRAATLRTFHVHEFRNRSQRRIATAGEFGHLRQFHRQLFIRHRHQAVGRTMDHRDRRAPVALPRNPPVLQAVLHCAVTDAALFRVPGHGLERLFGRQPVKLAGVEQHVVRRRVVVLALFRRRTIARPDDRHDRQLVLLREIEVALVVRRHAHHRSRAVFDEHVVRDPNRNGQIRVRIDRKTAGKEAFFRNLTGQPAGAILRPKPLRLFQECRLVFRFLRKRCDQTVFRRQHHKRRAEDGVDAGGEDFNRIVGALDREPDTSAFRSPNPIPLHGQDFLRPFRQAFSRLQQIVRVMRDLQKPLLEVLLNDLRAAPPAFAVDHLFVCQHGVVHRAPVHRRAPAIGQPALEHAREQPLVHR